MTRYIVPVGSDVVATWSVCSTTYRNTQFKSTTKEAILDESDLDLKRSNQLSVSRGFDVLVFNLPRENSRTMFRIAIRASNVMRK